jgi:regulatory protein
VEILDEITAIIPQVKDKRRCNIYVDGRFYCGLTLEATVLNRLKVGQIVSEERFAEIQLESEKATALDKAMRRLAASSKTEKQIREFLTGKGFLPAVCDYAVEKLKDYKFLDDGDYAKSYVEYAAKKKGSRLIRMELRGKGISEEEIDEAIDGIEEEDELTAVCALFEKYMKGKTADKATLAKAARYLTGKGFGYDVIKEALSSYGETEEE